MGGSALSRRAIRSNIDYDMASHWEAMGFGRLSCHITRRIRHGNLKGSALLNPCLVQPFQKVGYITTSMAKGFRLPLDNKDDEGELSQCNLG